jgi:hypothetical protein
MPTESMILGIVRVPIGEATHYNAITLGALLSSFTD